MRINEASSRVSVFLYYFLYFVVFQFVYQKWVTDIYEYAGFLDLFQIEKFLFSLFFLFLLIFSIGKDNRPSNIFIHVGILILFVPSAVLYAGGGAAWEFIFVTTLSFLIVSFSSRLIKLKPISFNGLDDKKILNSLVFFACLHIVSVFSFGGGSYFNIDLSKVYDLREGAAEVLPGFYAYINSAVSKTIIPFAVVMSLLQKRWIYLLMVSICSFLIFALTQHKAPIFVPILVVAIYIMANGNIKRNLAFFLIAIVVVSGIDFWLSEGNDRGVFGWFGSLFLRRTLLLPAEINSLYIEFFSHTDKYYWADSKVTLGLLDPPYDLSAPRLIGQNYGEAYFGTNEASANTGWIGSGFAQAGYLGIFIYSILLGVVFSFLNAYSKKIGGRIVIALFAQQVIAALTATDFLTLFITHGLFLALILLISMKPNLNSIELK
ncbi:hypothetical protein [Comamonas sp. GB3 AK4-5]|uniref:hypothetical protein n=1 Tax=Comamonas sp. GB3 AK4-5 TaxID=3231487 RepID=UPI00351F70B8